MRRTARQFLTIVLPGKSMMRLGKKIQKSGLVGYLHLLALEILDAVLLERDKSPAVL